jgi:DMSO/TMAO reductase YedYZ molybdopterin-dependent catalytic subunit
MEYHSDRPLTGSVPAHEHDFDVTPSDRMFVRNNLLTPAIDIDKHRLTITGLVDKELSFSVYELAKAFPPVTCTGMLECAGSGARTTSRARAARPGARPAAWAARSGAACASPTCSRRRA